MKRLLLYAFSILFILGAGLSGLVAQNFAPAVRVQDEVTAAMYSCPYFEPREVWFWSCGLDVDVDDVLIQAVLAFEKDNPLWDVIHVEWWSSDGSEFVVAIFDVTSIEEEFLTRNSMGKEWASGIEVKDGYLLIYVVESEGRYFFVYYMEKVGDEEWRESLAQGRLKLDFHTIIGNPYAK